MTYQKHRDILWLSWADHTTFLATTGPSSKSRSFARDFEMSTPEDIIVTTGLNRYSTSCTVSETLRAEQKEFADDISRWSQAFNLYSTPHGGPNLLGPETTSLPQYFESMLLPRQLLSQVLSSQRRVHMMPFPPSSKSCLLSQLSLSTPIERK
jgi:hypothetical protein